ncbi:allophanate hydrolase [Gracilibacillus sp. HCP3S3_G5_1]|uniref:allophanate hydrolase n=1 Tax=unclassified Gracilibacillus TaxID=2625209 RepID=UPI003F895128
MNVETLPQELTIEYIQTAYQKGELTPQQLMEYVVDRANHEKEKNIWITPPEMDQIAPYLAEIETKDRESLPLWGIPFAVKDNIDVKGMYTTAGCSEYAYLPTKHATVVKRLVQAGAIPVGKTNLDQFATGLVGTRSPYGETHNALKEELISGGSSSGSAVAVATGQVAFSLGTDTAGSGRVPASLNRLIGWKPSVGAWSKRGVVPACESIDCVTVFSHSLKDALQVDRIVRGKDEKDPWSNERKRIEEQLPSKLLIPKDTIDFFGPYSEQYHLAWERTLEKLATLSIPIEYIDYDIFRKAAEILYGGPWIAERWAALGGFVSSHPGVTLPVTEKILRNGAKEAYNATVLFQATHQLQRYKMYAWQILRNAVLITPTNAGTWTRQQVEENPVETNQKMGAFTNHCNLLDLSAIAVPSVDADQDVPFGITIFSTADQEGTVCGFADLFLNGKEGKMVNSTQSTVLLAVCGLHMRGYELEYQLINNGATFVQEAATAAEYQFVKLASNPPKPGLIRKRAGGASIKIELWEMPIRNLGVFVDLIPSPLAIGKVKLDNGKEVLGFICEGFAEEEAEDITKERSWHNVV